MSGPVWQEANPTDANETIRRRRAKATSTIASRLTANRDLLVGSISLMGTTIVTSLGGFVLWIIVARMYPSTEVGHASAIVSAITFLSVIGVFGLGTMLIGQLSLNPKRLDPLLPAALDVSVVLSGLLAVCFSLFVYCTPNSGLNHSFGQLWTTYALFVVGVAVSSGALVIDQATIGIGAGNVQWLRNVVMSACCMPGVVLFGMALGKTANSVLMGWTTAVVISVAAIIWPLNKRGARLLRLRSPRHLQGLVVHTAHHNTLNIALSVPRLAMPVVVAMYASGTPTAVFYVCWMIASFLYMIPSHLSTVLYAVASGDSEALRKKIRVTLLITTVAGSIGVPAIMLIAHPLLSVFGRNYAEIGAAPLAILALMYFPFIVKMHYAAIARVRGDARKGGIVCAIGAIAEISAAIIALKLGGRLVSVAVVLNIVLYLEALVMVPVLLGALRFKPESDQTSADRHSQSGPAHRRGRRKNGRGRRRSGGLLRS